MSTSALHERLKTVVGKTTYRALGQATNHNPETVRRYMSGQAPSVEFLASMISAYSVNADWLMTGRGPKDRSEVRTAALSQADPNELMAAIASRMEDMCDRVDRIEVFTQTMETRLRTAGLTGGAAQVAELKIDQGASAESTSEGIIHDNDDQTGTDTTTDDPAAARAGAIGDAITRRPRPDAD